LGFDSRPADLRSKDALRQRGSGQGAARRSSLRALQLPMSEAIACPVTRTKKRAPPCGVFFLACGYGPFSVVAHRKFVVKYKKPLKKSFLLR
jgi:hypothetical protein